MVTEEQNKGDGLNRPFKKAQQLRHRALLRLPRVVDVNIDVSGGMIRTCLPGLLLVCSGRPGSRVITRCRMEEIGIGVQQLLQGEQVLLRRDQDIIRDVKVLQTAGATRQDET